MTISLKPEQQRVVDLAIQSGAYQNPGEVIDQALAIIREQLELEDWMLERREAVAAQIATGFAQAERGELMDGDAALEMLRRRGAEGKKPIGGGRLFGSRRRPPKTSILSGGLSLPAIARPRIPSKWKLSQPAVG